MLSKNARLSKLNFFQLSSVSECSGYSSYFSVFPEIPRNFTLSIIIPLIVHTNTYGIQMFHVGLYFFPGKKFLGILRKFLRIPRDLISQLKVFHKIIILIFLHKNVYLDCKLYMQIYFILLVKITQ